MFAGRELLVFVLVLWGIFLFNSIDGIFRFVAFSAAFFQLIFHLLADLTGNCRTKYKSLCTVEHRRAMREHCFVFEQYHRKLPAVCEVPELHIYR